MKFSSELMQGERGILKSEFTGALLVPIFQLFCHKRSYKELMLEMSIFLLSIGGQFMFSTEWLTLNYLLSHQHSTTVSLETYPLYSVTEFISATTFTGNFVKK